MFEEQQPQINDGPASALAAQQAQQHAVMSLQYRRIDMLIALASIILAVFSGAGNLTSISSPFLDPSLLASGSNNANATSAALLVATDAGINGRKALFGCLGLVAALLMAAHRVLGLPEAHRDHALYAEEFGRLIAFVQQQQQSPAAWRTNPLYGATGTIRDVEHGQDKTGSVELATCQHDAQVRALMARAPPLRIKYPKALSPKECI